MSFVLLKAINLVLPIRAAAAEETEGLDVTLHGEEAYIHDASFASAIDAETTRTVPDLVPATAPSTY
jgi:hypothetical protein